ncbi:MAG: DNA polymerase III subunit gamma/tau [Deltaproteobacteria bacterium]|nr:DNA polymerase III subunit gamma/tau [Deltaproteobacteria bacterium]
MTYVVIARKWRPQQFSDVLGQAHVTRALTNAIEASRVAHAFLFSGPRGVGKTSAARILTRALCCESGTGPTATPCGVCTRCLEIAEGRSTDVFEIDAASHTGVDNVREIIENVRYLPSASRFKIYIIDEVHMLSTGAFNALLKTLEEPPAHVKFILATTDPHKVPVTILSRCQRYDFRRIAVKQIAERLAAILDDDGVKHDPVAVAMIAKEADGSMRDAQSLLEQVLAFSGAGGALTVSVVRDALGAVDSALVEATFDALVQRQPARVIELVGHLYGLGVDLVRFADALLEYTRDLVVAKYVADPGASIERPVDEVERMKARASDVDVVWLERTFDALASTIEDLARSTHPRYVLEISLAVMAEAPSRVPIEALVQKLDGISALLGKGGSDGPTGGRPGPSGGGGGGSGGRGAQAGLSVGAAARRGGASARGSAPGARPDASAATNAPERSGSAAMSRSSTTSTSSATSGPTPSSPRSSDSSATPSSPRSSDSSATPSPPRSSDSSATPSPPRSSDSSATSSPPTTSTPDFGRFVALVKARRPALAASLSQVRPLAFTSSNVNLGCETGFDEAKLNDQETNLFLTGLLNEFFGRAVPLKVVRVERQDPRDGLAPGATLPRTLTEVQLAEANARRVEKEGAAREHPSVLAVTDKLSGSIARVRVVEESGGNR